METALSGVVTQFLTIYGPLAIGWVVAFFLAIRVLRGERRVKDDQTDHEVEGVAVLKAYQDVIRDYHEAIVEIRVVLERLATLLEERTIKQDRQRPR